MSIHSVTLKGYSAIIESSNKMYLDLGTYRSCGNEYILINKDEEWGEADVVGVFSRPDGEQMDVPFITNTIAVPSFATKLAGQGKLTFIGYRKGAQIISTDVAYYCHQHQNVDLDPASSEPEYLTQQLLDATKEAVETANSVRSDADEGKFDGFSPVVNVKEIEGGHKISITDRYKTECVDVLDGKGIAEGGKQGQILAKKSDNDFDTEWVDKPTKLSDLESDEAHRVVTDEQIETWNNKSDFSGDYNDLKNKPEIVSSGYIVTITDAPEAITADRTASAIKAAVEAGQIVIAKVVKDGEENYFRLYNYSKTSEQQYIILFTSTNYIENGLKATTYSLSVAGEVEAWNRFNSIINPVKKTASMTGEVGIDPDTGRLFVEGISKEIMLVTFISANDAGDITVTSNKTLEEIEQALTNNLFVYGYDLTEGIYYNISERSDTQITFVAVSRTKVDTITIKESGAEFYKEPAVHPVTKTEGMTIPVGIDENGNLWTTPSGSAYNIGNGLNLNPETNTLSVEVATEVEQDNTKPITSGAVYKTVGNIDVLLEHI